MRASLALASHIAKGTARVPNECSLFKGGGIRNFYEQGGRNSTHRLCIINGVWHSLEAQECGPSK